MFDSSENGAFSPLGGSRSDLYSAVGNPTNGQGSFGSNIGPTQMNAGVYAPLMSSLTSTQDYLGGIFGNPKSSTLSTGMNIPENLGMSGDSSTPLGNESAQNSAQSAQKQQSNLQQAFEGVQSLYSPMGGRPIGGSEDVKVKVDAYGRPYTVVSMTPTDAQGKSQKAETLSFGISKEQKASASPAMGAPQGQVAAGTTPKVGDKGVYNPFAKQNEAQMQEYNRRKQDSMS